MSPQQLVRIDSELYELLKQKSEKTGVPIAGIVRQAVEAWIKKQKQ